VCRGASASSHRRYDGALVIANRVRTGVPKTLELKGNLHSQIIPAAPDIIKLFSANPGRFSESVGSWPLLVKRGGLGVLHHFPVQKRGEKTASFLGGKFLYFPHCGAHVPHFTKRGQELNFACYIDKEFYCLNPMNYLYCIF
jgi:hypothetical protein